MSKLISIRGSHGSGKSTIMRKILFDSGYEAKPIRGLLGARMPEAYRLTDNAYVLGPYITFCGGCDAITNYDTVGELIRKYDKKGHVLFEGFMVSGVYGRIGTLMEEWKKNAIMIFLQVPLETCIERVKARRVERGDYREFNPANVRKKYLAVLSVRKRVLADGIMQAIDAQPEDVPGIVKELIRDKH